MTKSLFSSPRLSPTSEYALIVGAGATAAASIAAQQVAAASLPLTTLVALGLLNRYRLDQRLQHSQTTGQPLEATVSQAMPPTPQRSTVVPRMAHPAYRTQTVEASVSAVRFSAPHQDYLHQSLAAKLKAKADHLATQEASLRKLGTLLKQQRQAKGWSLEDVYQRTFIQPFAIAAIEMGDVHQLPEPFYVRAFLRKYADALGLDGAAIAQEFQEG